MNKNWNQFAQLWIAIFIMSSSGVLGKMIQLPPPVTIWIRSLLGVATLGLIIYLLGDQLIIKSVKTLKLVILSGVLLGLHWITYFYSLHLSTVALGMLSLFTYPVITAILEPIFLKTSLNVKSVLLSLIAFVGVLLMIPEFSLENEHTAGILLGLFSSLLYSIRNIMLKGASHEYSGLTLMLYQLLAIVAFFVPVWFLNMGDYESSDIFDQWLPILLLSVFTTAIGHSLFVSSFKHFTITTVSIFSTLSPLLGTLLGFLFLDEVPGSSTFLGGGIVLCVVVLESLRYGKK